MNRKLNPDMRAAIDAALAAGRVTVVPQGTSGETLPVWNGTHLVYPDGADRLRRAAAVCWKASQARALSPEIAARRRRIMELHDAGHFTRDIANDLGVTMQVVWDDMRAMDVRPHKPPPRTGPRRKPETPAAIVARRDAVYRLWDDGQTARSIASALDISLDTIEHDLSCLRRDGRIARRIRNASQ